MSVQLFVRSRVLSAYRRAFVLKLDDDSYATDVSLATVRTGRVLVVSSTDDINNADRYSLQEWARLLDEENPLESTLPDSAVLIEVEERLTSLAGL